MVVKIKGRTNMADKALATVLIAEDERELHTDPLFEIVGGTIEQRRSHSPGFFEVLARHKNATDFEHDSAYVAVFEGAGLTFVRMTMKGALFTGVLLAAKYYTKEPEHDVMCDEVRCKKPHPIIEFQPPPQRIHPANYWLEVRFT